MSIVILGFSITTYFGLVRELNVRGHDVLFLQRNTEEHSANRTPLNPSCGRTEFYGSLKELKNRFAAALREADFVMVGSGLQDGIAIGDWVTRTALEAARHVL